MAKSIQSFDLFDQSVITVRVTEQTKDFLDAFRKLEKKRYVPVELVTLFQEERDTFLYALSLMPDVLEKLLHATAMNKRKDIKKFRKKMELLEAIAYDSLEAMDILSFSKKNRV